MKYVFPAPAKRILRLIAIFTILIVFISQISRAQTGITWTIRTSVNDIPWRSVTYGNGLFVAVGSTGTGNRVMTSPDGITWTGRTDAVAEANGWQSVIYGNGMFVAVASTGIGNRVMTSPDGITWTSRTTPADNQWSRVTYGNGLFVAVASSGTGNRVMTSPDGINWTIRASAADNIWLSVTYGNGLFVAVSITGTIMTSPDGINWTLRTSPAANSWHSVTYGNGLFVAVAYGGASDRVMSSPDGINWTLRTPAAANNWRSVIYGNGMFVAVASSGTGNRIMTSQNGINWTLRTSPADNDWFSITYAHGIFVAVGITGTGNRIMTSGAFIPLPLSWLSVAGDLNNAKQAHIKWRVAEQAVKGYEIEKSTDGINYSQIASISSQGDGENTYEFTEQQVLTARAWYRIKQTDIDGRFTYSNIIRLRPDYQDVTGAYPNPAKDLVTVLVGKKTLDKKAVLTDMHGKTLQTFKISSLSFTINVANYPFGCYILKIENESPVKIIKE